MSGPNNSEKHLPACGKCGYPARGIESLSCPECGADLREVGIFPRKRRPLINPHFLIATCYTMVVFILTLPFSQPFTDSIPRAFRDSQSIVMSPDSDTFRVVALTLERDLTFTTHESWATPDLVVSDTGGYRKGGKSTITLAFGPQQNEMINRRVILDFQAERNPEDGSIKEARLQIDLTSTGFELIQQGKTLHQGKLPLQRTDVLKVFEAIGVPHANTTAYRDADELVAAVSQAELYAAAAKLDGYRWEGTSSSGHFLSSNDNWQFGYLIFWLIVWILGLVLIARKGVRHTQTKAAKNIKLTP